MSRLVAADFDAEALESDLPPLPWDDLSRNVYCVLGLPIDAIDMPQLLQFIDHAIVHKIPFLVSTPNLNFLVNSRLDAAFRETLLLSEICSPDGMPLVWIARLIGLPIRRRVAGSDLLDTLRVRCRPSNLKLFLFGGSEGVAQAAATAINTCRGGVTCVGHAYPGFGTVDDLSRDSVIGEINASHADLLLVALGAQKGQSWLLRNYHRLTIPVRAHLGASINFAAGKVRRAPATLRKLGLEWMWRIKEEPHLWKRYWRDGCRLLCLFVTHVFPLVVLERFAHLYERLRPQLWVEQVVDHETVTLSFSGTATRRNIDVARASIRDLRRINKTIRINLANISVLDARFLGLLLMLSKQAKKQKAKLVFVGVSNRLRAVFRFNGAGFLLGSE